MVEQQQQTREKLNHREWEERWKPKQVDEWEKVIYKTQKKGKKSQEVFTKPYLPRLIKVTKWYEVLGTDSEIEQDGTTYSATMQQRSGYQT